MIVKADADLLNDINDLLNGVVEKPDGIEVPTETEFSPSLQLERMNDEISGQITALCVDKQNIRNRMMNYVALKYAELDAMRCKAKKLKDIFLTAKTTDEFSKELFDRTVVRINLYVGGEVGIVLTNNQEIRRMV